MNRKVFTGRGRRGARVGKPATPASRAATVSETAGSGNATPKSDMMSDLPPTGFTHGDGLTKQVSSKRRGYTYDDLDPRIVTAAKAAATRIRSLIAEIAEETLRREIQIGRELLAIKARLRHGHFGPWLAAEFGWSDRQARRFMQAAQGKGTYPGLRAENVDAHDVTRSIAHPSSIDAYMTKPETASRLHRVTLTKLAGDGCFTKEEMDALWFVEPSAGTGNFFTVLPKDRRIGIDINPLAPGIIKADFLTYDLPLDPSIIWGIIGNSPFRKGMSLKFIDRATRLGASFFALILQHTIQRPSMRNKIDPFFECIHHEVLPPDSFLRDGQVKYSPTVFEVWVRRDTPREPIIEQTAHPDWEWLPEEEMAKATAWMQHFGQGVGDIKTSGNLGRTSSPKWHWFIHCEPQVLDRLKAIDWRKVALPTASTPTLTKGEVVSAYRAYVESTRRALSPQYGAEPHGSWEPIGPFLRYGVDVLPDQPASSAIPSTSPQPEEAQKYTDQSVLSDEYVSWWAKRFEQFRQDLRPDGPVIANIKEEVIDDQRSNLVVQFRAAMRPVQAGLPNTLFISGCYANESA